MMTLAVFVAGAITWWALEWLIEWTFFRPDEPAREPRELGPNGYGYYGDSL